MSETLLRDIAEFCRGARMAESTFGRLAVNDGKSPPIRWIACAPSSPASRIAS
jgi:hypothetical protein